MVRAIEPVHFPWIDYQRYTFSLGVVAGGKSVLSGHTASTFDETERRVVVRGGLGEQAHTAYDKIEAILADQGLGLRDAVRIIEYLTPRGIDAYEEAVQAREDRLSGATPTVNSIVIDRLLRADALIEIAVTAAPKGGDEFGTVVTGHDRTAAVRGFGSSVYLPSIRPVDDAGDIIGETLVEQIGAVLDRAERHLAGMGMAWSNVASTVVHSLEAGRSDIESAARIWADRTAPARPASTHIQVQRLADPRVRVQLDLVATSDECRVIDPGWGGGGLGGAPAVLAGNVLHVSGQTGVDPRTGLLASPDDVGIQAQQAYANVLEILEAAGAGPEHLVETVEYLTPPALDGYARTAGLRERLLRRPYPASTGLLCSALGPPDALFEVIATAMLVVKESA
jgi:enamine deaminase RidA (YjgF/YER057c/UK114 family)